LISNYYLRALAGREKALGPDHTSTLDTVRNLGKLYTDQGKTEQARTMFLLRTHVLAYGLGRCGLGTWRTQGYLLYPRALLLLSSFFRFDVLVTVHLYDPL
jgi:hypothetical protein